MGENAVDHAPVAPCFMSRRWELRVFESGPANASLDVAAIASFSVN